MDEYGQVPWDKSPPREEEEELTLSVMGMQDSLR
jgi:hypothetical protein